MFFKFFKRIFKRKRKRNAQHRKKQDKSFSTYILVLDEQDYPDDPADMISDNIEHIVALSRIEKKKFPPYLRVRREKRKE